jgi:ABC-type thiamine transport system substrate-binding protein
MASAVDATFPADNTKVSKATFRAQMLIIKNEISALQQRTSVAGAKAFYGFLSESEVQDAVVRHHNVVAPSDLPRDIALGRASL